ncbi:hypothetical protein CDD81_1074 [Ophiocordyceps australis]|uniref:Triacylglycerol lipase n=1 Tax=Ophiocordyceps australis TaxID=1399860 RepID=A0A2C5X887_9HYPO|nr:hypothetical protein CDD81_1074 [Ophiocordyceps australis]
MATFLLPLALLAIVTIASAASPPQLQARAPPVLPSQDSFYTVPDDIENFEPGAIIRHRLPPAPIAAFTISPVNLQASHQILYRTTDSLGNATATVLSVLVPHNADLSKVLSYQAAEDAASIDCAPSYAFQLESATGPYLGTLVTQVELLLMEAALEQGWVVISPDFQGPRAAYLANKLAGQATLDGIRAAIKSTSFTGITSPRVTMWGYSGGSLATNWAAELQPSYAPELEIAGAAVGGTVPNITNVITLINNNSSAGLIPTGMLGLAAQYAELKALIDERLKPENKEHFEKPLKQCLVANNIEFSNDDILGMFDDPNFVYTDPTATRLLNENALGKAIPKIPLYWYKSVGDEISAIQDTDELVAQYCTDPGTTVEYQRDIRSQHENFAAIGAPKALSWLKDVMDGYNPSPGCSNRTVETSLTDPATFRVVPKAIIDALLDLIGKPVGPLLVG